MFYKSKNIFVHLIINCLIFNFLVRGLYCLKCYTCSSSNTNRDLDCQVKQDKQTHKLLRECNPNQNSCVYSKYEGVNPMTGEKFYNIVRECSNGNSTECVTKKKKSLDSFVCYCQGDGCNTNVATVHNPVSIMYLFILIFTVCMI